MSHPSYIVSYLIIIWLGSHTLPALGSLLGLFLCIVAGILAVQFLLRQSDLAMNFLAPFIPNDKEYRFDNVQAK